MRIGKYVTLIALFAATCLVAAQTVGAKNITIKGNSNDTVNGTSGSDRIDVKGGDDVVKGGAGNDTLHLGPGTDKGYGQAGNDIVLGDETGAGGDDLVSGGGGSDRLFGMAGDDIVRGDSGNDVVHGGDGKDVMIGGSGNDTLDVAARHGASAGDTFEGGPGNDDIFSRDGKRDDVDCGSGNDIAKVDSKDKVAANCEKVVKIG
jgi:Ca2+-binding RTX toxin-like protein